MPLRDLAFFPPYIVSHYKIGVIHKFFLLHLSTFHLPKGATQVLGPGEVKINNISLYSPCVPV